tara:strand:+ start:1239 stop:1862 length:624 start_codon:yes stop_codon:yes gene_type:complete
MASALAEVSDDVGGQSGTQYLSFSGKTGNYALGRNKDGMDPDDLFLLEPQSIIQGWVCWKANKPVDRVEWSIYKRATHAVTESDLEDHGPYRTNMGEGWQSLLGFGVLSTDGQITSIKFSATSKSGRNAIGDLTEEIKKRMMAGEPAMPLIAFDSEEFTAQEQKNFKPKFIIEGWVTRESAGAFFDGDLTLDQLEAGDAPKKKRKKK